MPWQEIRHLKAAKAARDQELAEAQKQLEAERFQGEELERNLLSQVSTSVTQCITARAPVSDTSQAAALQRPTNMWSFGKCSIYLDDQLP